MKGAKDWDPGWLWFKTIRHLCWYTISMETPVLSGPRFCLITVIGHNDTKTIGCWWEFNELMFGRDLKQCSELSKPSVSMSSSHVEQAFTDRCVDWNGGPSSDALALLSPPLNPIFTRYRVRVLNPNLISSLAYMNVSVDSTVPKAWGRFSEASSAGPRDSFASTFSC